MGEPEPVPEPAPCLEVLAARAADLIAEGCYLLQQDAARGGAWNPGWAIWARYAAGLESAIREASMFKVIGEELAAVPAPEPARHRHRVPRQRQAQLWPRLVRVLVPATAGTWAALKALGAGLRHSQTAAHATAAASWAGQHAAAVATGTAATGLMLTAVLVPAVTGHPAHAGHYAAAGIPAPAASIWTATRIPSSPVPSFPPLAHPAADVNRAGQLPPAVPVPAAPSSGVPVITPSAMPPAVGTLSVSTTSADLSSGQQVTIELSASGGPVTWGAWCGDKNDVGLSATSGTAAPGQPSYLTLSPLPDQDGAPMTVCRIWPGDLQITVTLPPLSSPSPSAVPSDTPTDVPSPDPSSS